MRDTAPGHNDEEIADEKDMGTVTGRVLEPSQLHKGQEALGRRWRCSLFEVLVLLPLLIDGRHDLLSRFCIARSGIRLRLL